MTRDWPVRSNLDDSDAFLGFLEQAPVGIFRMAPDGRILAANTALLRMLGCASIEELAGHSPKRRPPSPETWQPPGEGGAAAGVETAWRRPDGAMVWVREWCRVVCEGDRVVAYEGLVEDVSAQRRALKALADSEGRFRSILEGSPDLVQSVTPEGRFVYVNPAWHRVLGYSSDDLARITLWDVVREDYKEECRDKLRRLFSGETIPPFETVFVSSQGRDVFLEANVSCELQRGTPAISRSILRDVTPRKETEAQLRLQAAALAAVANGVAVTDRHGTILWVNPAFTAITGYAVEEALGQNPRLLRSGHHDRELYRELWATILSGRTWRGQLVNRRKDGTLYHEQMAIAPLEDERGAISHFVAVKEDVSERIRDQERLAAQQLSITRMETRLKSLIEHSPDAGIIADEMLEVVVANRACEELLGGPRERLIGKRLETLIPFWLYEKVQNARLRGSAAPLDRIHGHLADRDGTDIPVECSLSFETPTHEGWVLLHIVDQRPLQAADRAKRDFMAAMSHELRTPLTAVRGALGLLRGTYSAGLQPAAQNLVEIAVTNSGRLERMIDDILDFEALQRGRAAYRFRLIRVEPLVAAAVESVRPYGESHHVELHAELARPYAWVRGDEGRLGQVVTSLLLNAIEHSPRGERVSVETGRRDACCLILVRNAGPGIPPHYRDRVFDWFSQAEAGNTRRTEGSGLSLAASRLIVERHGGTIGFHTADDSGTVFSVELPMVSRKRASRPPRPRGTTRVNK